MKKLRPIIISICIFIAFVFTFDFIISKKLESAYNNSVASLYGNPVKDKGLFLQQEAYEKNNLMLYGSSELGVELEQNPKEFFPISEFNYIPNIIGKGNVQNLEHAINLGGINQKLDKKKIVYVVSLQWFQNKAGIESDKFNALFSEVQFYNYMRNKAISKENKKQIADRVYDLTKESKENKYANLYAKLYTNDDLLSNIKSALLKPYYSGRQYILGIKDKINSYKLLKETPSKAIAVKEINWENEYEKAEKQGKKAITKNNFYIEDKYFNTYLKDNLKKLDGHYKNSKLDVSKEYKDYELFLKSCKELKAEPLIVIMPVNGYWYDHMKLDKVERHKFYNRIEKMANDYGFKALNYSDKEYEKYFMSDGMHLGWRGWLKINNDIKEHFTKI